MYETLSTLKKTIDEAQARVKAEGPGALKVAFAELFAAHPSLKSVKWQQYTPYFNDGEPCEFGVHEFYSSIEGVVSKHGEHADGGEGYVSPWDLEGEAKEKAAPILDAVCELSRLIPADVMLASFGDHVEVVATRDGFQVDEYSHD